jgi:DNA-binding CsgD family transcriptional regulator
VEFRVIYLKIGLIEKYNYIFIISRLVLLYAVMELAAITLLRKKDIISGKLKKALTAMSWFFTLFVIPSMFIEDLVSLYYGMLIYNIFEAFGFLSLMTTILISGIYFLSVYKRNALDTISLLDVSEKYGLTQREMEVLNELVATASVSYKDIALKLNISPETVKSHVSKIYKKLGVSAKQELKYKIRDITT